MRLNLQIDRVVGRTYLPDSVLRKLRLIRPRFCGVLIDLQITAIGRTETVATKIIERLLNFA